MTTFTQRIYSEFNNQKDLHEIEENGVVLPEDRWSTGSTQSPSLLALAIENANFRAVKFNQINAEGSQKEVGLKRFYRIFDYELKSEKNTA